MSLTLQEAIYQKYIAPTEREAGRHVGVELEFPLVYPHQKGTVMTMQQIRYIMKIAETGSISRAARMLGVKQPSISTAVADLEKELGIVIFDRKSKGVSLTPAGEEFLEGAKRLAQSFRQLEARYGLLEKSITAYQL